MSQYTPLGNFVNIQSARRRDCMKWFAAASAATNKISLAKSDVGIYSYSVMIPFPFARFRRKTSAMALFIILSVLCPAQAKREFMPGPVEVEVLKVIDGDTFLARAKVWPGHEVTVSVRLRGIDAPERKGKCASELEAAEEARLALEDVLSTAPVRIRNISGDKYFARVIADAGNDDVADAASFMLELELARPYQGGKRQGWCS
jgi:micrococcal nuclease